MNTETLVTVYNYWIAEGHSLTANVSSAKATLDKIKHEFGSLPLLGTGQKIDAELLDRDGFYRRVPTGWMDLAAIVPQEPQASAA